MTLHWVRFRTVLTYFLLFFSLTNSRRRAWQLTSLNVVVTKHIHILFILLVHSPFSSLLTCFTLIFFISFFSWLLYFCEFFVNFVFIQFRFIYCMLEFIYCQYFYLEVIFLSLSEYFYILTSYDNYSCVFFLPLDNFYIVYISTMYRLMMLSVNTVNTPLLLTTNVFSVDQNIVGNKELSW